MGLGRGLEMGLFYFYVLGVGVAMFSVGFDMHDTVLVFFYKKRDCQVYQY